MFVISDSRAAAAESTIPRRGAKRRLLEILREREQQFHSDFDSWRGRRQSNPEPLRTGMTQTGLSADPTGMTQAEGAAASGTPQQETDPTGTATLGTTSRGRNPR